MLSIREILQFREAKLRKNKNYQVEGISDKHTRRLSQNITQFELSILMKTGSRQI